MKISAVYKITNKVTKDFYIGSSKNVKQRWANHKCPSKWNEHLNNPMYLDMQKYDVDKFEFQILKEVKPEQLKETEQQFIEMMKPTYNSYRAKCLDIEKQKEYQKSDKYKKYHKKYQNQLCFYNNETLTLNALYLRFRKTGIKNPIKEAKKYFLSNL